MVHLEATKIKILITFKAALVSSQDKLPVNIGRVGQ